MNAEEGLYFRRQDSVGFWRRLLIDLIDVSFAVGVCLLLTTGLSLFAGAQPGKTLARFVFSCCAIVRLFYFVVLKLSRLGTLGYIFGRVRIVGLDGRPPSWFSLILRLPSAAIGPLNLVDLVWLSGDEYHQALR